MLGQIPMPMNWIELILFAMRGQNSRKRESKLCDNMSDDSDIQIFNSVKSSVAVINIRIFFFTAVKLEAS